MDCGVLSKIAIRDLQIYHWMEFQNSIARMTHLVFRHASLGGAGENASLDDNRALIERNRCRVKFHIVKTHLYVSSDEEYTIWTEYVRWTILSNNRQAHIKINTKTTILWRHAHACVWTMFGVCTIEVQLVAPGHHRYHISQRLARGLRRIAISCLGARGVGNVPVVRCITKSYGMMYKLREK